VSACRQARGDHEEGALRGRCVNPQIFLTGAAGQRVKLTNRDLVGRGFELLAEGLAPFVESHLAGVVPGGMDWLEWVSRRQNRGMTLNKSDPLVLLRVITQQEAAFKSALSRAERSYAAELWECRNDWAHNSLFNEADTRRLLDTMERLLRAAGAEAEADEVQRLLRYDLRSVPGPGQQAPRPSRDHEKSKAARYQPELMLARVFRRSRGPGYSFRLTRRMAVAGLGAGILVALAIAGLIILPSGRVGPTARPHPFYLTTSQDGITRPDDSRAMLPVGDTWSLGGKPFIDSLGYSADVNLCDPSQSVTYTFAKSYRFFVASVGVYDVPGDTSGRGIAVEFKVKNSSGVQLGARSVRYGPSRLIYLNIQGLTSLTLVTSSSVGCFGVKGTEAVWGSARLMP
jgi:hypothetical protein